MRTLATTCILYFGSSKDATSVSKLSTAPGMKQAANQASIQNANSIERTVSPSRYQNHHEGIIGPTGQPWASLIPSDGMCKGTPTLGFDWMDRSVARSLRATTPSATRRLCHPATPYLRLPSWVLASGATRIQGFQHFRGVG